MFKKLILNLIKKKECNKNLELSCIKLKDVETTANFPLHLVQILNSKKKNQIEKAQH